jgi:hypothetical protein
VGESWKTFLPNPARGKLWKAYVPWQYKPPERDREGYTSTSCGPHGSIPRLLTECWRTLCLSTSFFITCIFLFLFFFRLLSSRLFVRILEPYLCVLGLCDFSKARIFKYNTSKSIHRNLTKEGITRWFHKPKHFFIYIELNIFRTTSASSAVQKWKFCMNCRDDVDGSRWKTCWNNEGGYH